MAFLYPDTVLRQAPTHFWRCTEASGALADLGSTPLLGLTAGLTYQQPGPAGADVGLLYDGVGIESCNGQSGSSYPDGTTLAFTLSLWIKPADFAATRGLAIRQAGGAIGWSWWLDATTGLPRWGKDATKYAQGSAAPALGVWSHVAVVVTQAGGVFTVTHYLNGAANGGGPVTKGADFTLSSATNLYFGVNSATSGDNFLGVLTDIAVWTGTALTAPQLLAQYAAGATAPVPAPLYIRKGGSDSNDGLTPATAWATLGYALVTSTVPAGGDTIYVGAGTYRTTALTVTRAPASELRIVGDVDGAATGDPGEVVVTGYATDDATAPIALTLISAGSAAFHTFERITFVAGSALACTIGRNCTFRECVFYSFLSAGGAISHTTTFGLPSNLLIERCILAAMQAVAITINLTTGTTGADYDANIVVRNTLVLGADAVALVNTVGSSAVYGGGIVLAQNTVVAPHSTPLQQVVARVAARYPTKLINNTFVASALTAIFLNTVTGLHGAVGENNRLATTALALNTTPAVGLFTNGGLTPLPRVEQGQALLWGLPPRPLGVPLREAALLPPLDIAVQYAPTVTDDAAVGTLAWASPGNAASPTDALNATATAIPAATGVTHYLKALGGLTVPPDATIRGVVVELVWLESAGGNVVPSSVRLVKGGVIAGTDRVADAAAGQSNTLGLSRWGSPADPLWGLALTAADVNAADFGAVVSLKNTHATLTRDASVDWLRVSVSFTSPTAAALQTVDALNRPRPAGLGLLYGSIGAFDLHDTGARDTGTTHGGAASLRLTGPADHQFDLPVNPATTTVTVWARYDAGHGAATKPQVAVLAQPDVGVAAAVVTMAAAVDTWEQLTLTFTPTARGIVTLRLVSRAAAGTGSAFFDDVEVT